MAYTTIDNPELYFQTKIYTGNGSTSHAITLDGSEDMQPDMIWIKSESAAENNVISDSVRGDSGNASGYYQVYPNTTGAEYGGAGNEYVGAIGSDGFTVGSNDVVNTNTETYAAWCWKAGTSFTNDASATSIGSIDSAGSVSDTAGFSICTYTGISSAGTIKHGLSTGTPSMIIWKNRTSSNGWITYHHKNTSAPETDYLELHDTTATVDLNTIMNDTAPTSSVFSIGTEGAVGGSNTNNFVAYIFSERQGYSKFGSYTGNGNADGPFVYLGFRPAWILIKGSSHALDGWHLRDTKRSPINPVDDSLHPNSSGAETSDNSALTTDFLSNGFKLRNTDTNDNGSGRTYIYAAFAEAPFVNSNGVPCNAR